MTLQQSNPPEPSNPLPLLERYSRNGGPIVQFWLGLRFGLAGLGLFVKSPRLQLMGLFPAAMTGGSLVGSIWFGVKFINTWLEDWLMRFPQWLATIAELVGSSVVAIAALIACYVIFIPVVGIISGPFRDSLSKRTEQLVRGTVTDEGLSLGASLKEIVKVIGLQLGVLVLLVGLGLTFPGVGTIPSVAIAIFLTTLDMVDPALGLRGYSLSQKLRFVRKNLFLLLGFGVVTFFVFTIPVLNLLILPVATVGGTLLVMAASGEANSD